VALAPAQMTPGRKFLKAKFAELDSINGSSEFQEYKWLQAGPNPGWPQKLNKEAVKRADLSTYEKVGVGMLAMLAAEYPSSDGVDNEETTWTRCDVEEVIRQPLVSSYASTHCFGSFWSPCRRAPRSHGSACVRTLCTPNSGSVRPAGRHG